MANFVSNDNATSLMNAINQKKDSKPSTITWAEWIALTDEQREGTHYIITNVPARFSDKDAVFSIKDQTLTFTNKTATVTDSRITADTYIFTFYHNQAVAQAAGIECSWTTGTVTFTVDENPSDDIVVDILCILPALATPPSEGGGHVIEDASGTNLPQQDTMQFVDAHVTDDSINGRTKVEVVKSISESDFDDLDETDAENEGIYEVNSNNTVLLTDDMIAHDATHTVRDKINGLEESITYSTVEHIVGKWIDGSDLYEKTVSCGALPNATSKDISHGIANISKIVEIKGYATNGTLYLPLSFAGASGTTGISVYVNTSIITFETGMNRSNFTESYVTLRYTKTS